MVTHWAVFFSFPLDTIQTREGWGPWDLLSYQEKAQPLQQCPAASRARLASISLRPCLCIPTLATLPLGHPLHLHAPALAGHQALTCTASSPALELALGFVCW